MTFIVATNLIASRPPECRPTGTPHARANFRQYFLTPKRTPLTLGCHTYTERDRPFEMSFLKFSAKWRHWNTYDHLEKDSNF